ncbi:MAG: aminopeptidase [Deltaproteobacteria bacterium]|nr:aminopeptidase [Deltaproteobacteria bacterium]
MIRPFRFLLLILLSPALFLSACSPFYVLRAAYEEGKILWRREPIAQFLEKTDVNQDTQEKLKLVLAVRDYARDVLKMNVGGSYASYSYVDRPDLTFILTAAPKTELKPYTWWFLIVGRVPYMGYFSKVDAEAAAADLQSEGYDTNIRPSAAFSTLGWFDDPLLSHLLRYDKVTLAEVVFHELFHNTLYVKGAGNFNESSANFIGHRAAIDFFRDRFGENSAEHQRAIQAWQEELEFSEFIEKLGESLSELYGKEISLEEKLRLREGIFGRGKKEWEERIAARPAHRFRGFAKQPLNNAVMIHYLLYLKNLRLFEALYELQGRDLARVIAAMREAVPKGDDPFETVRGLNRSPAN